MTEEHWSSAHVCRTGLIWLPVGTDPLPCSLLRGPQGRRTPDGWEASALLLGLNAPIPSGRRWLPVLSVSLGPNTDASPHPCLAI